MQLSFEEMPDTARVWIYQADRKLRKDEIHTITEKTAAFTEGWEAHGEPLKAGFNIFYDQFVVILVDEEYNQTSGCSIDTSVHFIKNLETELGINFFDRSTVAFMHEDKVMLAPMHELKDKIAEGVIKDDTITFNNLVTTKSEFETQWKQPARNTWLSKYFTTLTT